MTAFRLVDDGYPAMKKIKQGSKWVGRVVQHAEGGFVALINGKPQLSARGASEREAFEEVVAKYFGHSSAASLHAHNSRVRQERKATRAVARYAVDQAINHSNFEPFMEVLKRT
jgi:hypothetical protein